MNEYSGKTYRVCFADGTPANISLHEFIQQRLLHPMHGFDEPDPMKQEYYEKLIIAEVKEFEEQKEKEN